MRSLGVTQAGQSSSSEFLRTQHQQFLQLVSGGDPPQGMINSVITIWLSSPSNSVLKVMFWKSRSYSIRYQHLDMDNIIMLVR